MDYMIDFLEKGNYELLSIVIISSTFVWLFKEFRTSYINRKKESKIDIEHALEAYSSLYHSIMLFQSNEIDLKQLFNSFNQTISYLPRKIAIELLEINREYPEVNISELNNIKILIKNEITSLKVNQYSVTSRNSDDNIFNQGEWFFFKYNFDALINPFLYSAFTFLGMSCLFMFVITITKLPSYEKFYLILILFNSSFMLIITIHIMDLLMRKLLRKNTLLFYLSLILAPWLLFTFVLSFKFSIINTLFIAFFFYLALKNHLLRPTNSN